MNLRVDVMIMSGVKDGAIIELSSQTGDGHRTEDRWSLSIGRKDENDIVLRNDTYVSRQHANLHWKDRRWWLEDCKSTNGTFIENANNYFEDIPVKGIIPIDIGQIFRVGRTWMRIQPIG